MKKKIIGIILVVMMLCTCTACGKEQPFVVTTEEGYVVEQDACYMFQDDFNKSFAVKVEDGYYFMFNRILYYADENLELTAMCNKPNCLHALETDEDDRKNCKGYMGDSDHSQIYYHYGRIYAPTYRNLFTGETFRNDSADRSYRVYSVNEKGKDEELLEGYLSNIRTMLIHRGYMYYSDFLQEEVEEDGKKRIQTNVKWERMDMTTGVKEELATWQNVQPAHVQEILAYRNYVYCRTYDNVYVYSILQNMIVNELKVKVSELPCDVTQEGEKDIEVKPQITFVDDRLLLQYPLDSDEVFVSDLEGNNVVYAFKKQGTYSTIGADKNYIYVDNRLEDKVSKGKADRILKYYAKDTYEYIGEINLGASVYRRMGYGDEKYFFYLREYDDENFSVMYFEKEDIGTDKFEIKELIRVQKLGF